jgi:hypothetical protein
MQFGSTRVINGRFFPRQTKRDYIYISDFSKKKRCDIHLSGTTCNHHPKFIDPSSDSRPPINVALLPPIGCGCSDKAAYKNNTSWG